MSASAHAHVDEKRMAQATEWFGRLREESLPPETIADWLRWCEEDPDNLRAYRGVQEIWALAGDAGVVDWPHAQSVRADQYEGEVSVEHWRASQLAVAVSNRRWRPGSLAAVAAALVLAVVAWHWLPRWYSQWSTPQYATERGVQRAVQLSDGSAVRLGGASTIRVDFAEHKREIRLGGGEAYFEVARDPARPFVVRTPTLRITALGTAFTVRADDVRTVVAVTDGRVEIAPSAVPSAASRGPQVLRAEAGQQIAYDARSFEPIVLPSDTATALGWQGGALTYVDEPLRAVVARLNRYSNRDVQLADGTLGELRFTGTVFETQIEEWARGLERVFPVRAVVRPEGGITIARAE